MDARVFNKLLQLAEINLLSAETTPVTKEQLENLVGAALERVVGDVMSCAEYLNDKKIPQSCR